MSNDEEKEEEEVRREHTHLEEEQRFVSLSVRSIFLRIIRAFRCTRRAILDFFGARDRRVRERGGGAASRGISRIFSFWGGFFLLVMMMPIAMCSDIVALFVSRFSQQQEEGHSEEEEEEEEHEDGALVRFASRFGSEEDDVL